MADSHEIKITDDLRNYYKLLEVPSPVRIGLYCLETLYFPEDHTAEHITEMMENMLQDWKIKKQSLSGITTNNASNMKKAFENFPCVWFSCFGYNLNLAISKVLKMPRMELLPEHADI
ncbi:Zinc finger BED domain-containing protein 1 [Merluccius polli]|uniref:Zinc finger BED domain-containing protein 1 n=1 Tax=Merluccius polli TaxID=89951 RepID=A0AA47MB16_MERPO|nr:Zinc finger BED domain-containing protein 1 [Merluccius polli]